MVPHGVAMSIKMTPEQIEKTHTELVCMINSLIAIDETWSDRLSHFLEKKNYIGILETTRKAMNLCDSLDSDELLLKAKVIELSELLESHYEPLESNIPTDEELKKLEDEIGEELEWENGGDSGVKPEGES